MRRWLTLLFMLLTVSAVAAPYWLHVWGTFAESNVGQAPDRIRLWLFYPGGDTLVSDTLITPAAHFSFVRGVDTAGVYSGRIDFINGSDSTPVGNNFFTYPLLDTGSVTSLVIAALIAQDITATIDSAWLSALVAAAIPDITANIDWEQFRKDVALVVWNYLLTDTSEGVPEASRTIGNAGGFDDGNEVTFYVIDTANGDAEVLQQQLLIRSSGGTLVGYPKTNNAGEAMVVLPSATYGISMLSPTYYLPPRNVTISAAVTETLRVAGLTVLEPVAAGLCMVQGTVKDVDGAACAYCQVVFELEGATGNCVDTVGGFTIMDKTARTSTNAAGTFSKELVRTDYILCEAGENNTKPKWRATIWKGERRASAQEWKFYTDSSSVNIGSLLR